MTVRGFGNNLVPSQFGRVRFVDGEIFRLVHFNPEPNCQRNPAMAILTARPKN